LAGATVRRWLSFESLASFVAYGRFDTQTVKSTEDSRLDTSWRCHCFVSLSTVSYGLAPDWVERRTQRRLLSESIESVGGWDALKRDCSLLVEQHKDDGLQWFRHGDTNALPAAVATLKPMEVRFYPPGSLRGSQNDTTVPVVRIRIFGMPSTGGNASPYLGLEVVCSTNTSAYEPRRGYSGGVPGNRHSTFRRVTENVFEIY
jgi:hypothetical protein